MMRVLEIIGVCGPIQTKRAGDFPPALVLRQFTISYIARFPALPTDSISSLTPLTVLQAAANKDAESRMIVAILRIIFSKDVDLNWPL
jgi:hypothetical protein